MTSKKGKKHLLNLFLRGKQFSNWRRIGTKFQQVEYGEPEVSPVVLASFSTAPTPHNASFVTARATESSIAPDT